MEEPPISPSKQTRILIWRNEVATALAPDTPLPSHRSGISSAPSSTSTTSTKSSSLSARSALIASRVANLFRRLSPSSSKQAAADAIEASKTDMYISLRAEYNGRLDNGERAATFLAEGLEEDAHLDEYDVDESDGQGAAGAAALKEKQDRLLRAARLLHQGPAKH